MPTTGKDSSTDVAWSIVFALRVGADFIGLNRGLRVLAAPFVLLIGLLRLTSSWAIQRALEDTSRRERGLAEYKRTTHTPILHQLDEQWTFAFRPLLVGTDGYPSRSKDS